MSEESLGEQESILRILRISYKVAKTGGVFSLDYILMYLADFSRELEEAGIAMGDRHAMTVEETERELKLSAEEFEKDRKEEEEGKFGEEEGARAVEVEEEAETEARRKREEAMTEEEREVRSTGFLYAKFFTIFLNCFFFFSQHLKSEAAALKKEGNELYGSDRSEEAIDKYTEALEKCPLSFQEERAVFAANRAAAKFRLVSEKLELCRQKVFSAKRVAGSGEC